MLMMTWQTWNHYLYVVGANVIYEIIQMWYRHMPTVQLSSDTIIPWQKRDDNTVTEKIKSQKNSHQIRRTKFKVIGSNALPVTEENISIYLKTEFQMDRLQRWIDSVLWRSRVHVEKGRQFNDDRIYTRGSNEGWWGGEQSHLDLELSDSDQLCPTSSNSVQLCPTLSSFVQFGPTLSNFVQLCPTRSSFVQFGPTLSNFVQLWPMLSNFVQLCLTLSNFF